MGSCCDMTGEIHKKNTYSLQHHQEIDGRRNNKKKKIVQVVSHSDYVKLYKGPSTHFIPLVSALQTMVDP